VRALRPAAGESLRHLARKWEKKPTPKKVLPILAIATPPFEQNVHAHGVGAVDRACESPATAIVNHLLSAVATETLGGNHDPLRWQDALTCDRVPD